MFECTAIVGAPRQGKSNYSKSMLLQRATMHTPCYVFDPKNEYGDTYFTNIKGKLTEVPGVGLVANKPEFKRSRYIGDRNGVDLDYFLFIAAQKTGAIILIDEGTGVLKGRLPPHLNGILTGRFHSRNSFIIIFHSLGTIPPDIIRNSSCDNIVLFNTLDNTREVHSKFNNPYLDAGLRIQTRKPNFSPPTIIKPIEGKINGHNIDRQISLF